MSRTRIAVALTGLMAVTSPIAGCSPSAPSGTPVAIGTIAPLGSPVAGLDSPTPAANTGSTGPTTGVLSVDPTLLALLPAEVEGTKLDADANTALEIAGDAALRRSLEAVAVATAFSAASTDTVSDYAVATVARLRPGVFDDAWFRDWRDSFDAGVCAQAGGVQGNAQSEVDGRPVFIGTCSGGVHTWHVYLPREDVVISVQGTGDRRFGEQIIAGLTT